MIGGRAKASGRQGIIGAERRDRLEVNLDPVRPIRWRCHAVTLDKDDWSGNAS